MFINNTKVKNTFKDLKFKRKREKLKDKKKRQKQSNIDPLPTKSIIQTKTNKKEEQKHTKNTKQGEYRNTK